MELYANFPDFLASILTILVDFLQKPVVFPFVMVFMILFLVQILRKIISI